MRKFIFMALCGLSLVTSCFGQNKIIHEHDIMADKDYYYMKSDLLVSENGRTGFRLSLFLKKEDNRVKYNFITCKVVGVGSCHENDKLIILFEDSSRVEYIMWNKFNCSGDVYFDINGDAFSEINKPIKAIRITNGRTYDSYTKVLTGIDKNYFIDCYNAILKQDIQDKQ